MSDQPGFKADAADFARAWGAGFAAEHHPALRSFAPWSGVVERGWDVNFLGVKTKVAYFSLFEKLADYSSERQVETSPPVQNEDYFEWIDLLESVLGAGETFRMIELGAGWGKWLANGIAAARQVGRDYEAIGVEAEPKHFAWMRDHLRVNGVDRSKVQLVPAAVAAEDGHVWFHVGDPADWYGQRVEDAPPEDALRRFRRMGGIERILPAGKRRLRKTRAVSLNTLLADFGVVDLIDSDVQGSEADVFEAAGPALDRQVRRVHIGTHSVENEERLRRFFGSRGWELLRDYPGGVESETTYGRIPFEDGVQAWLNPRLNPS